MSGRRIRTHSNDSLPGNRTKAAPVRPQNLPLAQMNFPLVRTAPTHVPTGNLEISNSRPIKNNTGSNSRSSNRQLNRYGTIEYPLDSKSIPISCGNYFLNIRKCIMKYFILRIFSFDIFNITF